VVADLIRRARGASSLEVFGTGSPLRQFCFAPDLAKLILWALVQDGIPSCIALVPEEEHSIAQLAKTIADISGCKEVRFDPSKADGQYRKTMDNKLLRSYLSNFKFTSLEEGLRQSI